MVRSAARPTAKQIRAWLEEVPDPELPAVSVVDLGIVREVAWQGEELVVTVTPTYAGCPATEVIAGDIREALARHGMERVRLQTRLAPPWTTDWLSARGKAKLRDFGIAPPAWQAADSKVVDASRIQRRIVACPRCGSANTVLLSRFGSTPCKALYRCEACREPFDYFKPH